MSNEIILNADARLRTGTNKNREIRREDSMVPAVIYGNNEDTKNIKVPLNEITKAFVISFRGTLIFFVSSLFPYITAGTIESSLLISLFLLVPVLNRASAFKIISLLIFFPVIGRVRSATPRYSIF